MDVDKEIFCAVSHLIRLNLYGTAARFCDESSRRVTNLRELSIVKAYCLSKAGLWVYVASPISVLGKSPEAIRLLNDMKDEADLDLAVFTAFKISYSNEKSIGR